MRDGQQVRVEAVVDAFQYQKSKIILVITRAYASEYPIIRTSISICGRPDDHPS